MAFEYKVVDIPRNLQLMEKELKKSGISGDQAVAGYLEGRINELAKDGWEYVRSEQMSMTVNPGCFAVGGNAQTTAYNVAVFRKQVPPSVPK